MLFRTSWSSDKYYPGSGIYFGFHMGVRGAALATILSQALSCIWVLCFLFGKKTIFETEEKIYDGQKRDSFSLSGIGFLCVYHAVQ